MHIVPQLMRLMRRSIVKADSLMSIAHLRILDFLARSPGASLSEVSGELEITNATASSHIEKLVKRHLVKRVEHPEERRRIVLTLTPEGRKRLDLVKNFSTATFADMLATLTPTKLSRIQEGLSILEESARQYNEKSFDSED
ncbi:MAG TPA: MarR family winged helix-turn-helix transcriptional regulator [Candidatus Obscuribacterales bacterium]